MEVTSPSDIGPDDPPTPSKYFKKFPEKMYQDQTRKVARNVLMFIKHTHTHTHTHTPMNIKFTKETMFTK